VATRVFYTDALSSLTISGFVVRSASLSRGSGVVTKSQDSTATSPLYVVDTGTSGVDRLRFAIQVNAFSATTGNYNWNHWGFESNAMANFTASHSTENVDVYGSAGTFRFTLVNVGGVWTTTSEYGTSAAVRTPTATKAGTARTINDGDYIVFSPSHNTTGSPAAGYTLNFSYNGTSAGANGDTYMDCPDTFTEYVAPAGVPRSTPYPQLLSH
jgi:hypothetical protein